MKKVVCFCRVSSTQQDLNTQKAEVLKAIKNDNFKASEVVIVEGKESAIKLDEMERKTLNELKQVIDENPTITDIYFYAIDRLARKVSVVLSIVDQMNEKGINLHFLNPYPMQTLRNGKQDSMSKMFLTFLSIGAEMEMTMKKARFEDTKAKMKAEGKLLVGKVLFGYYRDSNGFPQRKEDEAEVVRYIFNEYLSGVSMRKIAKELMLTGKFENTKLTSAIVRVSNIINNQAYSGRQAKQFDSAEEKNIAYPAIVSVEDQDAAMNISKANNREKDTSNIYYAKGIVKTIVDKKEYVLSPIKGNCSYGLQLDSVQMNINVNVIDYIAWSNAQNLYNIYRNYENFIAPQNLEQQIEDIKKKIENLKPIFDDLDERMNRVNRLYKLSRMTDEEYDNDYNEIQKEKQPFLNEEIKMRNEIKKLEDEIVRTRNKRNTQINLDILDDEEKRDICKDMLEKIIVIKDGKYDYIINPIPSTIFKISVVTPIYVYNCSGGVKRLKMIMGDKEIDVSNEIQIRYSAPKRNKKG